MKLLSLILVVLFLSGSCKKQPQEPSALSSHKIQTIALKTGDWLVCPYIGGPGEDSMFSSWVFLDKVENYESENIVSVTVKTKNLHSYPTPPWIVISQADSGYRYQLGETLGRPKSILLWWIQKQSLTVPDADSAFVSFKY